MKVFVSRSSSNNKKYMFDQIKRDLDQGLIVYLLVPEQSTLNAELDIFEHFEFTSMIDLKVKSFRSIVNEVLLHKGGLKLNYISDFSQNLLIKLAIDTVKDKLEVYGNSIQEDGFSKLILDFIKVIKSNLLSPDDIKHILDSKQLSEALSGKMKDIHLIFQAYQELLSKSAYDGHDKVDLAISKIKDMEYYKGVAFYIDQFSNMSKQEISFVEELEKVAHSMSICLTMDKALIDIRDQASLPTELVIEDGQVFEVSRRFLNAMRDIPLDFVKEIGDDHHNDDINKVLKKSFSFRRPEALGPDQGLEDIHIRRYKNIEEECQALAIKINKDIYEEGFRYKDIAVVVAEPGQYYDRIKREFSLNKISYFMDRHRDLLENPLAKYIKSAISLLESSFSYDDIISYLKNAFYQINQDDLNICQNYLKERRVVGNMIFEDKYFVFREADGKISRYDEEDRLNTEISEGIRQVFLTSMRELGTSFDEIVENRKKEASLKEFSKLIYEFLSTKDALARIKAYEEDLESLNRLEVIEENRLVWNSFMQILDDYAGIDPEIKISFDDFVNYLEEAMADIKIGLVPPAKDQVQVGDFDRSRFMHVKKIYVLGLTNKFFPKAHQDADIFFESEKEELIDSGIELEDTAKRYSDKDVFAFYSVLAKADQKVELSYSLIDGKNEAMQEASIINHIKPLLKSSNIDYSSGDYKDNVYAKSRLVHYLPMEFRKINRGILQKDEELFVASLKEKIASVKGYESIERSIRLADKMLLKKERLSPQVVESIFPDSHHLSVTQLEKYNSCPYQHFIDKGISPRQQDEFGLDNRNFGNIAHESLDFFVNNRSDDMTGQDQVEAFIKDNFEQNVQANLPSYQLEDPRSQYYVKNLYDMMMVSTSILNDQLNLLAPDKITTEARYNADYLVDGKNYEMTGIIDRLDEYNLEGKKYFRIVDYKTGSKRFDLLKVYHGLDLQLMVYLYTAIKNGGALPLGAYYMKMNHKFKKYEDDEKLRQMVMINHQLDGLTLRDLGILQRSDASFSPDSKPNSEVIGVHRNRKDYIKQPKIVEEEAFAKIFKHVNGIVEDSIRSIKAGDIRVRPYYLRDSSPCVYCKYRAICRFQQKGYKFLEKYNDQEVLERIGGEDE